MSFQPHLIVKNDLSDSENVISDEKGRISKKRKGHIIKNKRE